MRLGDEAGAAGFSLVTLESVDSTNRLALDLAQQARANKTWVVSEKQREGRGRHGREWASPPGNLYASLLLVAPCKVADAPKLGFVAGLALAETAGLLAPQADIRLKWPNDLLADGAKLAGILLEGRMIAPDRQAVAIGMGINVAVAPALVGPRTTSLRELGASADRREAFRRLSNRLSHWLDVFDGGAGFAAIRAAWTGLALPLGAPLTVKLPAGPRVGAFAGIDDDGRLLLDTPLGLARIDAGDVFLRQEQGGDTDG